MTQFDDRFVSHPVWDQLTNLEGAINKAQQKAKKDDAPETVLDSIERLREVQIHIKTILDSCDPLIVPMASMNNLNSQLSNMTQQIQNYVQSSSVGHLQNGGSHANHWADAALQTVSQLHVPRIPEEIEGIKERITRFRRSAGVHTTNLRKQVSAARQEAKKAEAAATEKAQEIDRRFTEKIQELDDKTENAIQQTRSEISKTIENLKEATNNVLERLEQRIEQHEQNLEEQKKRIDDSITKFQSQFSTAQETRREEFAKEQKTRIDEFQDLIQSTKNSLETQSEEFTERAEEILTSMKEDQAEAEKVMEAIGTTGLTGGFKKAAGEEKEAADRWRKIAFGSIIAVIGVAVWTVVSAATGLADWFSLAKKIFLTGTISWLAAYAIKESNSHREREKRNKRLELQLASINPYLANLRPEAQEKIKDDLVKLLFREQDDLASSTDGSDGSISIDKLIELLQRVLNRPGT